MMEVDMSKRRHQAEQPQTESTPPHGEPRQFDAGPNPRTWDTHSEVGVEYRTRTKPYEAQIAFREKPSQAVIDYLKAQGFHWNGQDKAWARTIGFDSQEQDRLLGRRAYAEVVKMLQKELGIAAGAEVAF